MGKEKRQRILLSADGKIYLYEAIPEIAADLDACDEAFQKWKQKKRIKYSDVETFVEFLQRKYGKDSIVLKGEVGMYAGRINERTGHIEDDLPDEYSGLKHLNL